ncbi:uncharacterized protein [Henckelia pumila]|uniref:uncharacterized protein n=1 Tax=Henckelia pumila TaxID=405737 RepID=UPI003C6E511C
MLSGDSSEEEFSYDPKIEITLHRRRREARRKKEEDEIQTEIPEEEMAANANLSLRQLGTSDLNQQSLCITFHTLENYATFELKSGLIHLLPSFHGLTSEDPHKYLMEFHMVCTSMKPHGVTEEKIQLRAFPFSFKSAAKDWLYYLPSGSITTWTEMKRIFLEKYFPASRAANIRKEIYGIKQFMGESLHEYWERFKKSCASFSQHQISENLLIQYFHECLLPHDRNMLDAASGEVFVDKTPQAAMNLIENMAANSQKFGTNKSYHTPRQNNEVNVSSLEQQLIELTFLVRQMAVGNGQTAKAYGICTAMEHATDMFPTLQEGSIEQVNAAGGFPGPPQQKYDPYSNTYNPGWKDHHNLRYGNPPVNQPAPHVQPNNQAYRPPYPPQQRPHIPAPGNESKYPTLENSGGTVGNNNKQSGRELKVHEEVVQAPVQNEDERKSKVVESEPIQKEAPRGKFPPLSEYKPVAHFPLALKESRKDEGIKGLYENFRRCERKIPTKCKESGMFSIPSKIEDVQLDTSMLDLGASINVLQYSVYPSLKLRPLNETATVIQMTDRSTIYPRGVIEDVLGQVGNLVFPVDFYVLDMKNNDLKSPILLGRPFLKTSKSVIDVNNGTLTMKFDGEIVKFNIFDNLNFSSCESAVNNLDINDYLSQEHKKVVNECKLKEVVARPVKISLFDLQEPEAEEPKNSRNSKKRPKLTVKVLKWVKNRVSPPPQSEFQYDTSIIPLDMEEDDTTNT